MEKPLEISMHAPITSMEQPTYYSPTALCFNGETSRSSY